MWTCDDAAAIVVCDGCSSGANSEVGAKLGARVLIGMLAARLRVGAQLDWAAVRADLVQVFATLLEQLPGDRALAIREHFLFTVVAAVVTHDGLAVWAMGDGIYAIGDRMRQLGPFEDNQPPYLAYDLLGDPQRAHLDVVAPTSGTIAIATDGALELDLPKFAADRFVDHPDTLRRELAILARGSDRIDWDERRVARIPAAIQDDCAIGVVRWEPS